MFLEGEKTTQLRSKSLFEHNSVLVVTTRSLRGYYAVTTRSLRSLYAVTAVTTRSLRSLRGHYGHYAVTTVTTRSLRSLRGHYAVTTVYVVKKSAFETEKTLNFVPKTDIAVVGL